MKTRFRLTPGEPIGNGLSRVFAARVDEVGKQIDDPSLERLKVVHTARKTCKRLRALWRLVRPNVSASLYQEENRTVRDIARTLATFRESDVERRLLRSLLESGEDALEALDAALRRRRRSR